MPLTTLCHRGPFDSLYKHVNPLQESQEYITLSPLLQKPTLLYILPFPFYFQFLALSYQIGVIG